MISLAELHYQLYQMCRQENEYFAPPFLAQTVHSFTIYTIFYGSMLKTFLDGTVRQALLLNMSFDKWCWMFMATWYYIVTCWVLLAKEVSRKVFELAWTLFLGLSGDFHTILINLDLRRKSLDLGSSKPFHYNY